MDEYICSIFMNGALSFCCLSLSLLVLRCPHRTGLQTFAIHNTCEDSLLATPLIIDLVVMTELMTRVTYKTDDMKVRSLEFMVCC